MSTKIYEAYRFPPYRLNEFLEFVDAAMFKNVADRVEVFMGQLKPEKVMEAVEERKKDKNWAKISDIKLGCFSRFEIVVDMLKEAGKMRERTPFDIDCGWNLWHYKDHFYAIPWGVQFAREGIEYPEWMESYAYWNSTDRPDEVTQEEWDNRRDTWEEVCLKEWNLHRMTHNVVEMTPPNHIYSLTRLQMYFHKRWDKL